LRSRITDWICRGARIGAFLALDVIAITAMLAVVFRWRTALAVDASDRVWNALAYKPFDQVPLSPERRDLLRRAVFFKPLPYVRRVVFIATRHRGSFLTEYSVTELLGRFLTLPVRIVQTAADLAVKGDGPVEGGNDGVVEYSSAHLDDVDSEYIVRFTHSTQSNPYTIEEVRRILLLHAAKVCARIACGGPLPPSRSAMQAVTLR
jgi:hypothetical protein